VGLKDRLRTLEGGDDSCVVCGWGPDIEVEVVWDDAPEEVARPKEMTYCPACGCPDEIIVTWGDASED